jgi:isocitrate lyase
MAGVVRRSGKPHLLRYLLCGVLSQSHVALELVRPHLILGAATVHFEDQNSSLKKCGHMGGKVVVPTSEFIQKLVAAGLAADVEDVPT